MAQKINPIGIRLDITQNHSTNWYSDNDYRILIKRDERIRKKAYQTFENWKITKVEIARSLVACRVRLISCSHHPNIILCEKVKEFREAVINESDSLSPLLQVFIRHAQSPISNASSITMYVNDQLQIRVPFRKILRNVKDRACNVGKVKGIRVQMSGRLNGAEIARKEWIHFGTVPLHTILADVNFSSHPVLTIYGLVGTRVWIF